MNTIHERNSDIVCLAEIKLSVEDDFMVKGQNGGKRGKCDDIGQTLCAGGKVEYGQGRSEIVSVKVARSDKDNVKVMAVFVLQKPIKWPTTQLEEMPSGTVESLKVNIDNYSNATMVRYFNCSEVQWEEFEAGD